VWFWGVGWCHVDVWLYMYDNGLYHTLH
jgi:hypothetical protein